MFRNKIRYWWSNFKFIVRYRIASLFGLEIPKPDVFQRKDDEINEFVSCFNAAINTFNAAMNSLIAVNYSIDEKLSEVDEYQRKLNTTRDGLNQAKEKNSKVISNFRALLGSD